MKTKEQVLEAVKNGRESECALIDRRDYARLTDFFPVEDWSHFGFALKDGKTAPEPEEWNEKNILKHLGGDLDFAFEKALNKRGISSSLMYEVIKMWMWVLDDPLQNADEDMYAMYGLPLYRAVALKYGFPNPIGNDSGTEERYDEE